MTFPLIFVDSVDKDIYDFGDSVDNAALGQSLNGLSTISYRYIDLEETDYHFRQDCFDNSDIVPYFEFMSMLSDNPFNNLMNDKDPEWHLNPNNYDRDKHFQELVNKALKITSKLPVERQPAFYHFALYTNQNASRTNKIKSPRIYFFIGNNAVIYPLFYDPYHEINP